MSALPSADRVEHAAVGADAAGALYARHSSRIFAFCLSRLGNREEAEDATQTTFLNAFRSLQGGLEPRFELAWLFRIADNVCRDRRKSAWRRGRVESTHDLQELQDVLPAPDPVGDSLVDLDKALTAMPERQRRAILLREWQGLSYAEIASELGLSNAAVETLIFRARRSLARALEAPAEQGRRTRAGLDVGWLLGLAKSLLQGGGAVKVAVSVAAIAGAGFVASAPLRDRANAEPPAPNRAIVSDPRPAAAAPSAAEIQTSPKPEAGPAPQRATVQDPASSRERAGRSSLPRGTGTEAPPAGKNGPAATSPVPEAKPQLPASGDERPVAEPPPTTAPPASPPSSLPSLPEPPPVPPVVPPLPPVEPPAIPALPDLPVDVPELPPLPPLPPLP